jgi:hypothetical protein
MLKYRVRKTWLRRSRVFWWPWHKLATMYLGRSARKKSPEELAYTIAHEEIHIEYLYEVGRFLAAMIYMVPRGRVAVEAAGYAKVVKMRVADVPSMKDYYRDYYVDYYGTILAKKYWLVRAYTPEVCADTIRRAMSFTKSNTHVYPRLP